MQKANYLIFLFFMLIALCNQKAEASGISVDAGLTPAEDRWIVRMQFRQMGMDAGVRQMDSDILMAVVAYGYTRDITIMVKQMAAHRVMAMNGIEQITSGLTDLSVLTKFGLYRKNTRNYTLAIASTIVLELPTGAKGIGSETWDMQGGLYGSWRRQRFGADLNAAYKWNGFTGPDPSGIDPGNELGFDAALSYQFSIGKTGNLSLTPVVEFTYRHTFANQLDGHDAGGNGSIFFISPGLKFTRSSFILEALLQIPIAQSYPNFEHNQRGLIGLRYMF